MMRSSKPSFLMAGATVALALGLFACSAASPTGGGFGNTNNDPNTGNTSNNATTSSSGGTSAPSTGGSSGGSTAPSSGRPQRELRRDHRVELRWLLGQHQPAMTAAARRRRPSTASRRPRHHDRPRGRDRPGRSRRGRRHAIRDSGHGVRGCAQPGDFPNFCVTVPSTIQVGGFQSWMSEGSSHHFILYKGGAAPAGGACTLGANTWIYASSTPGQVITENMPPNVGLQIASGTQLILNMHFINPGHDGLLPEDQGNLLFAKNVDVPGRDDGLVQRPD